MAMVQRLALSMAAGEVCRVEPHAVVGSED
jgi:hypothetical protein